MLSHNELYADNMSYGAHCPEDSILCSNVVS